MTNNDIVPGFDDEKDESLKIKLQPVGELEGCLILHLVGYIDTYNSNCFQKRIAKAIEFGYIRLIFQCGGLNYVSSTGIGSFTAFLKAVKPQSGDLVLLEIQPKVFEVFQLLGFSQFFNIRGTMEEALYFFRRSGSDLPAANPFPKVFDCPICYKKLKAIKPGRFRCSLCKAILAIDNTGQVFLG
ncbi:MAG: STAS domain-containing protein [Treponema sp.]|jgi:anti-anti-sigma factor|nr:STAS domain-containing protein [Treponema sp.]